MGSVDRVQEVQRDDLGVNRRRFLATVAGAWFVLVAARRFPRRRGYSDIYYDEYGAYE